MWAAALHCSEAGQGEPHLLSEEEKALFVRMYAVLLNEHPTQTFEQLNFWRLGAGLLSRSPPIVRKTV